MKQKKKWEVWYSIVRYYFDLLRGEAVNIGILCLSPELEKTDVRFLPYPSFKGRRDMGMNLPAIRSLQKSLNSTLTSYRTNGIIPEPFKNLSSLSSKEFILALKENMIGNVLQLTEPRAIDSSDFGKDVESLYQRYVATVEPPKRSRGPIAYITFDRKAKREIRARIRDNNLKRFLAPRPSTFSVEDNGGAQFDITLLFRECKALDYNVIIEPIPTFSTDLLTRHRVHDLIVRWQYACKDPKSRDYQLIAVFYPTSKDVQYRQYIPRLNGGSRIHAVATEISDFERHFLAYWGKKFQKIHGVSESKQIPLF